ncbi:MAG: hypothetical protein Q9168_003586 [Polycauliona sp. 1 TL-2023]
MQLAVRSNIANGIELRILPLGDSISNGFQSSDNNGYRLGLQQELAGSNLLFVGSRSGGTMDDNWHEGWNGFTIDQILDKAVLSVANFRPNIILLHAGTNDLNTNPPIDPAHAPNRLGELIDNLISSGNNDSVILVAQIIEIRGDRTKSLVQKYNEAIPGVVNKRSTKHKIAVVDFRNRLQSSDYADDLHPNDSGYRKMADIWFKAIQDAASKGWIKAPQGPPPYPVGPDGRARKPGSHCNTPPIWIPAISNIFGPIASGVGEDGAMNWTPRWDPHWPKASLGIGKPGNGTMFGDLTGDGKVFLAIDLRAERCAVLMLTRFLQVAQTTYCQFKGEPLHTVFNADSTASVNEKTGSVILYQNTGVGNTISWNPVNDGKEIASGVAPRELIRFVDIDMDGKDDYVVLGRETGSVKGKSP